MVGRACPQRAANRLNVKTGALRTDAPYRTGLASGLLVAVKVSNQARTVAAFVVAVDVAFIRTRSSGVSPLVFVRE